MSVYEKLKALNIELPAVAAPAAAYVMHAQTGNTVFLSGHIAKKDGKVWTGQLGKNMETAEGKEAARLIAIDLIATLQDACGGDLNRVKRIVKLMSLVRKKTKIFRFLKIGFGCFALYPNWQNSISKAKKLKNVTS